MRWQPSQTPIPIKAANVAQMAKTTPDNRCGRDERIPTKVSPNTLEVYGRVYIWMLFSKLDECSSVQGHRHCFWVGFVGESMWCREIPVFFSGRERERERKRKFGSYQSSVHFDVSRSLGEKKRKVFKKRRKKGISVRSKKHASAMGGSDILMSYLLTRIGSLNLKSSSRQFPTSWTVKFLT